MVGQIQEDGSGNLYGTTAADKGYGTAYQLQERQGVWSEKNIHVFHGYDGQNPNAGLAPNQAAGVFYGTTQYGGSQNRGVIFALSPAGRRWSESTLHQFVGSDGQYPIALLTRDKATGLLYGTTSSGGNVGCGNAFELNPTTQQFTVLYTFQGGSDGCTPNTQLREGVKRGTLVGALQGGSPGALFLLTEKGGVWKKSVLHSFSGGSDGGNPCDLTFLSDDGTNSIYGVAQYGGVYNSGVVFQITRPGRTWQYRVIYNFTGGNDGRTPVGIHLDNVNDTLYGTTNQGGAYGLGTVFQLAHPSGNWTETVLHSFSGGPDGANPESRPVVDQQTGHLYGTTYQGGSHNGGTVYSVTP